jgi:hypothetical protein
MPVVSPNTREAAEKRLAEIIKAGKKAPNATLVKDYDK